MPEYTPPPDDLSRLNPFQRYMQKGQLDWNDYFYLGLLVAAYIIARPAIHKFVRWIVEEKDVKEGEEQTEAYYERRAKVGANSIRGGKDESINISSAADDTLASGADINEKGEVANRKSKGSKGVKSETDKLLDWDDEPARGHAEGDKSDVVAWLNKWDK